MDEIASNRHAWGTLAEDHYRHYRSASRPARTA